MVGGLPGRGLRVAAAARQGEGPCSADLEGRSLPCRPPIGAEHAQQMHTAQRQAAPLVGLPTTVISGVQERSSPPSPSSAWVPAGKRSYSLEPQELGIPRCTVQDLAGGDAALNARILMVRRDCRGTPAWGVAVCWCRSQLRTTVVAGAASCQRPLAWALLRVSRNRALPARPPRRLCPSPMWRAALWLEGRMG